MPQPELSDWLLYYRALTGGVDMFDARISKGWRSFRSAALKDVRVMSGRMLRLIEGLPERAILDPDTAARYSLDLQNRAAELAHQWKDKQIARLGLVRATPAVAPSRVRDLTKLHPGAAATPRARTIRAMNRVWRTDVGGPARLFRADFRDLEHTVEAATGKLTRVVRREVRHRVVSVVRKSERAFFRGGGRSWCDNMVAATEYIEHQVQAVIIDATSGPIRRSVIRQAAIGLRPSMRTMELSFLTHQRGAFRAGLGAAGLAMNARKWAYYSPPPARAGATEAGFRGRQYATVRSEPEWEATRRKLDAKRPGSFIFTTGFHPGDAGYLLPIPPALLAFALEHLRRVRQEFLERVRAKGDAA